MHAKVPHLRPRIALPMLTGAFLVSLCFTTILLTSVLFLFGVTVTPYHLPLAALCSAGICLALSGGSVSRTALAALAGLLIAAAAIWVNLYVPDLSWDGNRYHKPMAALLRDGWNPTRETFFAYRYAHFPILNTLNSGFIDAYPKGSEIIAACIYALTGRIAAGKAFNLIGMAGAACVCSAYLRDAAQLKWWQAWLCAALFTVHPISLAQAFNYYNDAFLWQMVLLCVAACLYLLFFERRRYRGVSVFLIFATIHIGFNVKFSGVLFFALPCAALFALWAVRLIRKSGLERARRPILRGMGFYAASVASGFALSGSASYATNLFRYHNPFCTIIGKGASDIITPFIPDGFESLSPIHRVFMALFSQIGDDGLCIYKLPFQIGRVYTHMPDYDQRIGGWGPFFGELLIIGALILLAVWLLNLRRRPLLCRTMELFVALGLFSAAVVPGLWWPRYFVAPLYIPACAAVALFALVNRTHKLSAASAVGCMAMLFLVNTSPALTQNWNAFQSYGETRREMDRVAAISERAPVIVTFNGPRQTEFYGRLFDLLDAGVDNFTCVLDYYPPMSAPYLDYSFYYSPPHRGVWAADDLVTFVEEVGRMDDVALLVSVRNEASASLTADMIRAMRALGLEFDMRDRFREAYVAVLDDGEPLYEAHSGEALSYRGEVAGHDVAITSAGYAQGDAASIRVDGRECAVNARGLNLVLIDRKTGAVLDSVAFDTFASGECTR